MAVTGRQFAPQSAAQSRRRLIRISIAGMLCLHLLFLANLRERIKRGYPDFTVFYTAATILREGMGHQLYDPHVQYEIQKKFTSDIASRHAALPYIHPPFEALIFLPLTWLPYAQAFLVWDLLNAIALCGVALLLRRNVDWLRLIPVWEFVIGSLAFFPVFSCFFQGQDSILLLLLCAFGFNALKSDADFRAGCWLALGAFKFQLIVPMVLLMVIWKRRLAAAGFLAVCALLALASIGLVGWQGLLHYPTYVLQIANAPSLGGVPAEILPNLRGLLLGWSWPIADAVGNAAVALISIALFLFAATRNGSTHAYGLELQFSQAIIMAVLIGWQTNIHDLSLLVLPLVLIVEYSVRTASPKQAVRFDLMLPVLPILISPLWILLFLVWGRTNLMAIPLLWWAWVIGKESSRASQFSLRP